jgi:hypothetical protein
MIVEFHPITLDLFSAIPGEDADTITRMLAVIAATGSGHDVQTLADDSILTDDWIALNLGRWFAVLSGPTLTGVARRQRIDVDVDSPIQLNQTSTIDLQVMDNTTGVPATGIYTVSLKANGGVVVLDSVTTDSSGFASTTFKPSKSGVATVEFGGTGVVFGTTPPSGVVTGAGFVTYAQTIVIDAPASGFQQNWIEENDLKDGIITTPKLDDGAVTAPKIGEGVINTAPVIRNGMTTIIERKVNTVLVDSSYIYVNGYDGPGDANPVVVRIDKVTGVPTGSFAYTNNDLTTRFDGMADDGTDIWVAAGGDLIQLTKATMTSPTGYTIDSTGGSLQFVLDDGTHVLSFLRGGTSLYADEVVRINKTTGVVDASRDVHGDTGTAVIDHKEAAILGTDLYLNIFEQGSWIAGPKSLGSAFALGTQVGQDPLEKSIVSDGETIWIGGTNGIWYDWSLTPRGGAYNSDSALLGFEVYAMASEGDNRVWALTSDDGGSVPTKIREFYRPLVYSPGLDQMLQSVGTGRVFNMTLTTVLTQNDPSDVAVDADGVYAGNFNNNAVAGASKETVVVFEKT